jgi:hypothetical protein
MNLAQHQQELSQLLLRGAKGVLSDDPYTRMVSTSPHLELLRETILWWREFDVERTCPLTSELLRRRGVFQAAVEDFSAAGGISPFVEILGQAFLEYTARSTDAVTASMARFERAVIRVKLGDPATYIVDWPCDPRDVLNGVDAEPVAANRVYRTYLSKDTPGFVRMEEISKS